MHCGHRSDSPEFARWKLCSAMGAAACRENSLGPSYVRNLGEMNCQQSYIGHAKNFNTKHYIQKYGILESISPMFVTWTYTATNIRSCMNIKPHRLFYTFNIVYRIPYTTLNAITDSKTTAKVLTWESTCSRGHNCHHPKNKRIPFSLVELNWARSLSRDCRSFRCWGWTLLESWGVFPRRRQRSR